MAVTAVRAARTTEPAPNQSAFPAYDVRDLTMGGDRAEIHLDGKIYTLRITRAGKLILTK